MNGFTINLVVVVDNIVEYLEVFNDQDTAISAFLSLAAEQFDNFYMEHQENLSELVHVGCLKTDDPTGLGDCKQGSISLVHSVNAIQCDITKSY